jgi:hypothetical protein
MGDFFSLEPLGIGTAEIEGLPSYICRLAKIHALTVHGLLAALASWNRTSGRGYSLPANPIYQRGGGVFCGVGPGVSSYVRILTEATDSRDIDRTTFTSLVPAISRQGAGLSRRSRAWCPACFEEHRHEKSACYDRLIWAMAPMVRCPTHKVELISDCPSCAAPQIYYHRSGHLGRCWKCCEELVSDPHAWTYQRNPSFGERDCVEVVEAIAKGDLVSSHPRAFQVFFDELLHNLSQSKRLRFGPDLFGKTGCNEIRESQPHFSSMIRYTNTLGVRLVDVLSSPVESAKVAGDLLGERVDRRRTRGPHKPQKVIDACQRRLQREIFEQALVVPPSLTELAKELHVSLGFLRYRFAALVESYEEFRTERRRLELERRRRDMHNALLEGPIKEFPSSRYPDRESLAYAIMQACGVGRRAARMAVQAHFLAAAGGPISAGICDSLPLEIRKPANGLLETYRGRKLGCSRTRRTRPGTPAPAQMAVYNALVSLGPSTVRAIHEIVYADKARQYTTTSKLLENLRAKGLVTRKGGSLRLIYTAVPLDSSIVI